MAQNYEIGQIITIPKGAEVNHGLHEDSDSFIVPKPWKVRVIGRGPGGLEILIPGHEDLSPAYWHQPEPKVDNKPLPTAV